MSTTSTPEPLTRQNAGWTSARCPPQRCCGAEPAADEEEGRRPRELPSVQRAVRSALPAVASSVSATRQERLGLDVLRYDLDQMYADLPRREDH